MKWTALFLLFLGCSRSDPAARTSASTVASIRTAPAIDASVTTSSDAQAPSSTIDAYCTEFVAHNDSPEGFRCYGEQVHPTCDATSKKSLATLGKIALLHEKGPDGVRSILTLVDASRHYAVLGQVTTEECDIGDPADVSLELVSASESADAGAPTATIVFDSLRIDPPFQGGTRTLTATRRAIRCRSGAAGPECDKPTTLGTFAGPLTTDKPPPFSQWSHTN